MDESLEQRVEALEKLARDQLAGNMALDMVIRALIATHPDPAMLGDVIEGVLKQRVDLFRETGFERGYEPSTAKAAIEETGNYALHWIGVCRAAQAGE